MPFYDYRCNDKKCNNLDEFFEGVFSNENTHYCSKCKGESHRIISGETMFTHKNLPFGHNLSATERRRLWNSDDPKDFRKINGGGLVKKKRGRRRR